MGPRVNVSDQAYWTFTVTKPGTFDVEILQGCGKGSGNAEVAMVLLEGTGFGKDQTLSFTVQDTGHFQNFVPRNIGKLKFEKAGEYTFLVKPLKKPGVAVMDLRQVKMTPVK
jgi:arylsulfatase A